MRAKPQTAKPRPTGNRARRQALQKANAARAAAAAPHVIMRLCALTNKPQYFTGDMRLIGANSLQQPHAVAHPLFDYNPDHRYEFNSHASAVAFLSKYGVFLSHGDYHAILPSPINPTAVTGRLAPRRHAAR